MKLNTLSTLALSLVLAGSSFAAEAKADAWKFENSVTATAGYDSNVYQTTKGAQGNNAANYLSVSPSIKASKKFSEVALTLNYQPTAYLYTRNDSLNYLNQVFGAQEKFTAFDFAFDLKQGLSWNNGQTSYPAYSNDAGSTYTPGFAAPAELGRLDGLTWTEASSATKKWNKYLLEIVSKGTYSDFGVANSATSGYINSYDRYDVNVGTNLGYEVKKGVYALGGVAVGYQWQGASATTRYPSKYVRVLVGARGEVVENVKVDFLVGPDFRAFDDANETAGFDKNAAFWYYTGSVTYTPTKKDTITGTFTRAIQVSSTGANAFEDVISTVKYGRVITSKLSAEGGVKVSQRPYLQGAAAAPIQDYTLYSPFVGVSYKYSKDLTLGAGWTYEEVQADSAKPAADASVDNQQFVRNLVTVSAKYSF